MENSELDINALAKGKMEAFLKLYKSFFVPLCVFARNFQIEKQEAEDVVQDVFCKLYDERHFFDNIHTLKSYLYTSVRNGCLNYIRGENRRKKREARFLDDLNDEQYFFDQIVENEIYRELHLLMNELPEQCRHIFNRTLNGETSEQIASDLGLSIETVKTQRKKAKHILRERYALLFKSFGVLF